MKILIVDDSRVMRMIIANALKESGFEDIIEAGDGQKALEILDDIGLIITDWHMPIMNGLELVFEIRKLEDYNNTPIIMVTSVGTQDLVVKALRAGVNDIVIKPFDTENLMEKVKNVLEKTNGTSE